MAKTTEALTVQILRQIRDELAGLNGRVDALNERVDGLNERVDNLTQETRDGFLQLRREIHAEMVQHRKATEGRFTLIERRVARLESHQH